MVGRAFLRRSRLCRQCLEISFVALLQPIPVCGQLEGTFSPHDRRWGRIAGPEEEVKDFLCVFLREE
jgi:hypothetical protein